MLRNLKALGFSLAVLFAVSATVVPAASADELTSDGPVKLIGEESSGKSTVTAFETNVTCDVEYLAGLENQTPHTWFDPSMIFVAKFTVAPYYTNCASGGLPATVVMNGCDYLVHVGNGVEDWEVVCPESAQIEVKVYSGSSHSLQVCAIKIPDQSKISGGSIGNIEEEVEKITLGGPLKEVDLTKSGLCGSGSTGAGQVDIHAIVSGVNESGKPTGVKVD